jgi:hypothetical protein
VDIKFTRSFFGYDPEEVEHIIRLYTKQYEDRMRELTDQLFDVNQESEAFQQRIKAIKQEIENHKRVSLEIMNTLFDNHLQATKEVYAAIKKEEGINRTIKEEYIETEKKRIKIKETLDSLTKEMELVAQSYNNVLEAYKNG